MLGEATARALEGYVDEASDALDKAEAFVIARTQAAARFSYFIAGAVCLGIVLGLTVGAWGLRSPLPTRSGQASSNWWRQLELAPLARSSSMLLQMRNAPVDAASEKHQQYADAGARIFMGMIGAVVVALCVRAGLVLPQLKPMAGGTDSLGGLLLACMVAGASERLAPALINRLGQGPEQQAPKLTTGSADKAE